MIGTQELLFLTEMSRQLSFLTKETAQAKHLDFLLPINDPKQPVQPMSTRHARQLFLSHAPVGTQTDGGGQGRGQRQNKINEGPSQSPRRW